jgi:uncharacterized membrane protein YqhA
MNADSNLDRIRNETLKKMDLNELYFKITLVISGIVEVSGLVALVLVMNWSDQTHIVIFVASLLVYLTLGMWTWALAHRSRVGEQRIIRAVEMLEDAVQSLRSKHDIEQA